jgi:cation diffusion facilitator family transporter
VADSTVATTARGISAVKRSFGILAVTAALQSLIVISSGSVALLADMVHNIGDAATAIPLWVAFRLARRKPTPAFTYGFGRLEDLAGIAVVCVVLASAIFAGIETVDRFLHPKVMEMPGAVAVAGVIGIIGNALVARLRIGVGREIGSAALIADGYHARIDSLTSLAVVAGALCVGLGFSAADPIVGLIITAMIFGIVWQSAKTVLVRLLDGIDPRMVEELRHVMSEHVPGVAGIQDLRMRWVGHRLYAETDILVDESMQVSDGLDMSERIRRIAGEQIPALASLRISFARRAMPISEIPPQSPRSAAPN